MELLEAKTGPLFRKYFVSAFGSGLMTSIYTIVDVAVVGHYGGAPATAAMALIMPLWTLTFGLGLMVGIGGGILYSTAKGRGDREESNRVFTSAMILMAIIAAIMWILVIFFDKQLFTLFGADETLMPIVNEYFAPIKIVFPCYAFGQMMAAFLRNDGDPGLAAKGVLIGGLLNIVGDPLFVFGFGMGVFGAGLATALGAILTITIMLFHFVKKSNSLKFVRVKGITRYFGHIILEGIAPFILDMSTGIISIFFNRQTMEYMDVNALAVFGVLVQLGCIVQACSYGAGEALQPIVSANFGAQRMDRVRETLKHAVKTALIMGILWITVILIVPNAFVYLFMDPTATVMEMSSYAIRIYSLSFIILPVNVVALYFFQSLEKSGVSIGYSLLRGVVFSGILAYLLPYIFGANIIWWVMPIVEAIILILCIISIKRSIK